MIDGRNLCTFKTVNTNRSPTEQIVLSDIKSVESVSSSEFVIETDSKYHFRTSSEWKKTEWINLINKYRADCYSFQRVTGAPLVFDHRFTSIYIGNVERVHNTTVPSDILFLIARYVDATKRVDWFSQTVRKSRNIDIFDEVTIIKRGEDGHGYDTVLCGDGGPLNRSRWTKYEVVFRINKMSSRGFRIGYVFESIQYVDFENGLGWGSNTWLTVGITIKENEFYSFDEDIFNKPLECESEDGPSTFPKQGQIWRVSWDLIDNEMEISVLNQQGTDWIPMIHYAMKQKHRDVIPAFSLHSKGDSITLVSERV